MRLSLHCLGATTNKLNVFFSRTHRVWELHLGQRGNSQSHGLPVAGTKSGGSLFVRLSIQPWSVLEITNLRLNFKVNFNKQTCCRRFQSNLFRPPLVAVFLPFHSLKSATGPYLQRAEPFQSADLLLSHWFGGCPAGCFGSLPSDLSNPWHGWWMVMVWNNATKSVGGIACWIHFLHHISIAELNDTCYDTNWLVELPQTEHGFVIRKHAWLTRMRSWPLWNRNLASELTNMNPKWTCACRTDAHTWCTHPQVDGY